MFCFRAPQTDLSYYLLLTMKLMFITFGLFPISSKTTQQNSLQLILKNYSILLFNNTSCIQNLTTNPYELANCNEQIIKFLNSTSLGSTACSTCTNNFVCITPANYSILEQIGSYCEQTVINTTYFQISQEKLDQIIKSMDSYGKKLISPDTKKYLGDSVYSPFHIICTICTRNYSMMDKLLKVTNLMNKSNCTDNYHDCEIPLPLLQYKNVLFLCVNCSQNNTITVVQTINSTFSFTQLFDIVMQTSLEVENEFHQLFTPPSVNVTSFCSVDNVALNEGEQNNYTLIRKNASSAYTQIHSKAEQIKLSRRKRNSEPNTNDIYSTMHSHLLPPRNLQIVPLSFGSLNISWIPAKVNEQFITHYELILFSLNEKSDSLYDHCFRTHTRYNHTGHHVYLAPFSSQNRQVFINVTAPADYAVITGLPPDNFYRVLLFAVGNSLRSPPATMPSSPRVPALSPQTPPDGIKITPRGTQSAKISWNPPSDVECMGELMNYVININSSRLIEPIIIKVPQSKRSHIVENLIPGTFYTVQVSATTRGGLGVPSKSVHFQTGGELPKLDPDELEGIEISKSNLESNMGSLNVDFFEEETKVDELVDSVKQPGTSPLYVLPSRIHNLRATPTQTSITLKWSIALRQINMDSETHLYDNVDYEYTSMVNPRHLIPVSMKNEKYDKDTTGLLPPGTKYIIRWGDMHPGPSEDSVRGDQTHYTIENLRPGTIYYIRVISVTEGGDGPAAYTVVMTQDSSAATKPTNRGLLIPVNLVVLQLGSTWARVGWDIPHIPQSLKLSISGFQVKYYSVKSSLEQEEYDGRQESEMEMTNSITEQFTTKKVEDKKYELKMINMTLLPNQILAEHFDIVLRDLKPATQYEFGVRMLHSEVLSEESNADNDDRTVKTYFWSMVQGFETFGKSKIKVSTS